MKSPAKNIQIASYDDLFKTDAERLADTQERIQMLALDKLVPFPNHPFKVLDDEKMQEKIRTAGKNAESASLKKTTDIWSAVFPAAALYIMIWEI